MGNTNSSLHSLVQSNDISGVRIYVQDHPSQVDEVEQERGWSALHLAAFAGHDVIVRELLARKANSNLQDKDGQTPLHLAAAAGRLQVARELLQSGASLDIQDAAGRTPLRIAAEFEHGDMVEALCAAVKTAPEHSSSGSAGPSMPPSMYPAAPQPPSAPFPTSALGQAVVAPSAPPLPAADDDLYKDLQLLDGPSAAPPYMEYIQPTFDTQPTISNHFYPTANTHGTSGNSFYPPIPSPSMPASSNQDSPQAATAAPPAPAMQTTVQGYQQAATPLATYTQQQEEYRKAHYTAAVLTSHDITLDEVPSGSALTAEMPTPGQQQGGSHSQQAHTGATAGKAQDVEWGQQVTSGWGGEAESESDEEDGWGRNEEDDWGGGPSTSEQQVPSTVNLQQPLATPTLQPQPALPLSNPTPAITVTSTPAVTVTSTAAQMAATSVVDQDEQLPPMFVCPITQDVMEDPVFATDGYTYERVAIEAWIQKHNTSPMTNLPLPSTVLVANLTLRSAIKEWLDTQH